MKKKERVRKGLSSFQLIIISFASMIIIGSLLLMLPFATKDGKGSSFFDALFTATSASCVTGLVVRDTATYWSGFGQAIILLLIQIGGMGVITMILAFSLIAGRKMNLRQRNTMREAISAPSVAGIAKLTGFVIITTLIIEALGTIGLSFVFCKEFGFWKGLWYSLFHSVSAFCNAGFDLMGSYSSLTSYVRSPLVNIIIVILIVVGGIGFLTWDDIKTNKHHLRKYRMQSKVILVSTAFLILIPALYLFFFEFDNVPLGERTLASLFQSVTLRTAGFNTMDLTSVSEPGQMIMIVLMLIGGAPGSTAGGMKITTFAVMLASAISVFRRKEHTHFFGRRLPKETEKNALTIAIIYISLFLLGGVIISKIEGIPMLTSMFETASAIGTVGLTLGITPQLGVISRIIIIVLMFVGRVGGLTLVFSALKLRASSGSRMPEEAINVG